MTIRADDLTPLVARWLPVQRFFAGKGRPADIDVEQLAVIDAGPPEVAIWIARVNYTDGRNPGQEIYQLPLAGRRDPVGTLEHVLLGTLDDDGSTVWVYDALHDRDLTQAWLTGIRDRRDAGGLRFDSFVEPAAVPVGQQSIVLSGEQSNTSLIFGDTAILKVFRRLESGINPDIEVHAALTRMQSKNIAALLGSLSADVDGEPASLAMLQEFLTTGTDGWEIAKSSVRDLMGEADLHPAEAGGDFASEAERLGAAVAEAHTDLATAFGTDVLDGAQLRARGAAMHARLDAAREIVPALAASEAGLRTLFDNFLVDESPLTIQRIHGDLHLGQVMRTVRRWVILDFEGEPVASISERRAFDSPLRDIAGMLRSFDYASRHQLVDGSYSSQLAYRADEWADRNRAAFCAGFAAVAGFDPRHQGVRLRAFEADKAVYEAVYEARNRPSWLGIPLASLSRLAKPAPAEGSGRS